MSQSRPYAFSHSLAGLSCPDRWQGSMLQQSAAGNRRPAQIACPGRLAIHLRYSHPWRQSRYLKFLVVWPSYLSVPRDTFSTPNSVTSCNMQAPRAPALCGHAEKLFLHKVLALWKCLHSVCVYLRPPRTLTANLGTYMIRRTMADLASRPFRPCFKRLCGVHRGVYAHQS